MHIIKIPKSNGKFRTIYVPNAQEKASSSQYIVAAEMKAATFPSAVVLHGFTKDRSPVTNALVHRHRKYTLSFDLKDFFDSVKPEHIRNIGDLAEAAAKAIFYRGAARQGLPSSPAIANLAACPMDTDILKLNTKSRFGWLFVYTRYADDLTFSFDNMGVAEMLMREVPAIAKNHGFQINKDKTKLQCQVSGRRIITGISVGESDIRITREMKRRIRAGLHQLKNGFKKRHLRKLIQRQLMRRRGKELHGPPLRLIAEQEMDGLLEWAKLKLPKNAPPEPVTVIPQKPVKKIVSGNMIPATNSVSYAPLKRRLILE